MPHQKANKPPQGGFLVFPYNSIMDKSAQAFPHLHVVILATTSTLQLWPLSRAKTPLELSTQIGGGESLLIQAIEKTRRYTEHPIIIATTADCRQSVSDHLKSSHNIKPGEYTLHVETYPRGNALTLALIAARLRQDDPGAIMLVLPANQRFKDDDHWRATAQRLYRAAIADYIAVAGVTANVKGAYMHQGPELNGVVGAYRVTSYMNTASPAYAYRASRHGSLVNARIMSVGANIVLASLKSAAQYTSDITMQGSLHLAETAQFLAALDTAHLATPEAKEVISALPDVSYEDAVFQSTDKLAVVPSDINLQCFDSLQDIANGDSTRAIGVESQNTTTMGSNKRLVVTLGTKDLLIVDTPDALLIADKNELDRMPSVIAKLRNAGAPELLSEDDDTVTPPSTSQK
jgi:mannose-1-phosphate guanylyltransferase